MTFRSRFSWALRALASGVVLAASGAATADCSVRAAPAVSFVAFQAPNIDPRLPTAQLTVKGKLSVPGARRCGADAPLPAVLILHGSSGVDARGDFYQQALNAAGIATLQIDMWEARGVTGLANRPQLPIYTFGDAFAALAFLGAQPGIDAGRIGVLGFSWGGVVSLAASESLYAGGFGGGRQFKAHVAHYPVCYGANNAALFAGFGITPAQAGAQYLNPTGAPVLIQIGSEDDYDNGTAYCRALADSVNTPERSVVSVVEYPGAFHAWDRIMIPVNAPDPFGNEGSFFSTGVVPLVEIVPDVEQARAARERVLRFFRRHL